MHLLIRLILVAVPTLAVATGAAAQTADFETTEVADGVYKFRWQSHNTIFVLTGGGRGVVAFDPISMEAGRQLGQEITRVAPNASLLGIVYSHHHADHITGAPALMEAMGTDAPIFAHARGMDDIEALNDPNLPPPDVTFREQITLKPGGRAIELHYLGRSHSDNMLVGVIPDVGVAFAVDFIAHDRMGYQELPDYYFPEFFPTLGRVLDLNFTTMVFGHGADGDRASIQRQIAYYDDLKSATAAAVARGLTEDEAAEQVRLPDYEDWDQYDTWLPMNVRALYRWLAAGGGGRP